MAQPQSLTADQLTTWRAFLRAHAVLVRRLEADLLAEHGMPMATYDVLVQLSEAPERRLRMTELADAAMLSRSGLTRLVDRLVREKLVVREACSSDARGTFAAITDEGFAALERAAPTHVRGVAEYFVDRLPADELAALGAAMRAMNPAEEEPLPPGACGMCLPTGTQGQVDVLGGASSRTS